jgi:3-oxoacyl-[acyl-carrier protein] reductase
MREEEASREREHPFDLSGRVALVTGASQGLGRRFAEVLAEHGAAVGLAARQTGKLKALEESIRGRGGQAASVPLDVGSLASIEQAFDAIEAALGPVGVLVNNAGVAVTKGILEQTEADWDQVVGTNLKGAFFVAKAAATRMAARDGGSIINVASVLSYGVVGHLAPYAASKGGLLQITRAMALELARAQVRVNAIAPGYIETEINREFLATETGQRMLRKVPQRRFGEPGDLDGALLLLASDASRYMTGSVIVVDGGFLLT